MSERVKLQALLIERHSIAGSETTATTLSCIIYHLLQDPEVYAKATNEIRGAFAQYEDINAVAAGQLQYLRVLALEAMRIYPPLPLALPRVVPAGGDTVDGYHVPEGVSHTSGIEAEALLMTSARLS